MGEERATLKRARWQALSGLRGKGGPAPPAQSETPPGGGRGRGSLVAFSVAGLLTLGLMAGVFLLGIWSNTGRVQGPEQIATTFADLLPFGYAFAAGVVASVNPCGFLMLPGFVGYAMGAPDGRPREFTPAHLLRALLLGVTVTLGFLALFSAIGIVIATGGDAIVDAFPWAGFAIGVGLTLLGLWLALTGRSLGLAIASRVAAPKGRGLRATFLYGVAYGVCSLSCTLPVFLVVVATALATDGIVPSLGNFLSFALGMGMVVTAVTLGAASLKGAMAQGLRGLVPHAHRLGAILLSGAGVYLIVYWVWLGELFR